ncbi:hypothetical protein NT2_01_04580 [Caenibius tardaugens NBRC 16725]|uniref:Spore coat protein U/FanG domain-containing protein n=1 Tax=Caenibius tardaugens NBRC 16725 TaxID=1219035 RepID=U2Y3U2_9SPHN|nr:spore coat U domain-containing protein [Caenibius tardaugens]GAD47686.1 hypothetical protein NT2_01_04580 [Caenibius tardaugens NBRC 16725]
MRGLVTAETLAPLTAMLALIPSAHAETSKSFELSAAIAQGCAVDGLGMSGNAGALGSLSFGSHPSVATTTHQASLNDTQSVTLRCTPGVALTMSLDGGLHNASGNRNLQLGSDTAARLLYTLCTDAGCSQPIGINQAIPVTVNSSNMNNVRIPVVGKLTLPGNSRVGTFTDTVTVTLSW